VPRPPPRLILPAIGLCAALACTGSEGGEPRTLRLVRKDPGHNQGVFLNEPLSFHFSAEVDPLSVGRESIVIETAKGERARGELEVEGRKVVFRPDVPHAQDLSDGGYRPGVEYLVRIAGFPRPDGIRAATGEPLAQTERWSFTTVALDAPRRGSLFDDPHQEHRKPPDLYPGAPGDYTIGAADAIYLGSEKQIDPTSVRSGDFKLVRQRVAAGGAEPVCDLFARLVENEPVARRERPRGIASQSSDKAWRTERRAALIELTPVQPLEPGRYVLQYQPARPPAGEEAWSLRDFSRRPLFLEVHGFERTIQVDGSRDSSARGEAFVEDFVDRDLRTPLVVADCDGTAAWEGSGRVEVHYPLAAGDGSADAVSLSAEEPRTDLQATSIDLAPGATCRLAEAPGLVILRAQGRITLRGNLERRAPLAQPLDCDKERGVPLTGWLARVKAANPSWTIVIAGGDLVIDSEGEIRSEVPVLLIAGGQIRNSGKSSLPVLRFWSQSGAGGMRTPGGPSDARFELDPPIGANPLKRPLRFAVVSGPVPQTGGIERWISAYSIGGLEPPSSSFRPSHPASESTASSWSVRYFPADAPHAPDFSKGATSPVQLPQPGSVRFVVELVLGDKADWQAPYVDRVQLAFERAPR
jgi:hypothetical protein